MDVSRYIKQIYILKKESAEPGGSALLCLWFGPSPSLHVRLVGPVLWFGLPYRYMALRVVEWPAVSSNGPPCRRVAQRLRTAVFVVERPSASLIGPPRR